MLPKLSVLFQRPRIREVVDNLGWLVAERILRLGLNVAVGFWVARYLGAERFGALNYAMAVVGIAVVLAELGLDGVVRREIAASPERAPVCIATAGVLRFGAGCVAWLMVLTAGLAGWAGESERMLLVVVGLTLFQPALCVTDLWFQATLRAKYSAIAQLGGFAAAAAVRIGLILGNAPLVAFGWAAVAEMAVAGGWMFWLARRADQLPRISSFDLGLARRWLCAAWPLMLSGFAIMLYVRIDTIMLRALSGQSAAGIYSAATRLTELWFFVPIALGSSLLPSLLRARERGAVDYERRLQTYFDLNAALAYALALPLALGAPVLIGLAYGTGFEAAAPVLVVHSWSLVFVFLGVARGQFLVNEGYHRFYLVSTVTGLAVNVLLNVWLIPRHGPWGAALATLLAQAVAAWLTTFCSAPTRPAAWMQTRALLLPVTWFRYLSHG